MPQVRQLHANANYFRRRLLDMGLHVLGDWDSPVMPIMIYHPGKLPAFSRLCLQRAIATVVVGFPATALLLVRARICISAAHTPEDLEYAVHVFNDVCDVVMLKYSKSITALPDPPQHPTRPAMAAPRGVADVYALAEHYAAQGVPGYQALAQQRKGARGGGRQLQHGGHHQHHQGNGVAAAGGQAGRLLTPAGNKGANNKAGSPKKQQAAAARKASPVANGKH